MGIGLKDLSGVSASGLGAWVCLAPVADATGSGCAGLRPVVNTTIRCCYFSSLRYRVRPIINRAYPDTGLARFRVASSCVLFRDATAPSGRENVSVPLFVARGGTS